MRTSLLLFPLLAVSRNIFQPRADCDQQPLVAAPEPEKKDGMPKHLQNMMDVLNTMQARYFGLDVAIWASAIDWTAAVLGTQVSATLTSLASSFPPTTEACSNAVAWHNLINKYFAHTSMFYFGENTFSLRNEAYDDMLWVVLGWLENIKFSVYHSRRHFQGIKHMNPAPEWHGNQFSPNAAHRARIFWELASVGWDEELCHGGMVWNPNLVPYKNAITNQLFCAASIGMYLYHPGDENDSPFAGATKGANKKKEVKFANDDSQPHDQRYLDFAVKSYQWLQDSHMINDVGLTAGLYADGFHIKDWEDKKKIGTGKCDQLDTMVYTYNQGVILSASRGLYLATGRRSYLDDGHRLIENVLRATGWPWVNGTQWQGLGRGGVLEEACDHRGECSQDGQTFKGIFFTHFAEFCRPMWDFEEDWIRQDPSWGLQPDVWKQHQEKCAAYGKWVNHNAAAAEATVNQDGLFGSWWTYNKDLTGITDPVALQQIMAVKQLPVGAEDTKNPEYFKNSSFNVLQGFDQPPPGPQDLNDRGRGRTVESQAGGLAVVRARWNWELWFDADRLAKEGRSKGVFAQQVG
jgi:hypothetical protein